jgi:hypothetical protein
MQASVLDGHARGKCESLDQSLVIIGEIGRAELVGEVEVPVHLVAYLSNEGPLALSHHRQEAHAATGCGEGGSP